MVGKQASADLDAAAATFTRVRSRLFGVAYRMLGTVSEAEDIVQDVWLKWHFYERDMVRDPVAFLMTATTRLCITELTSARALRNLRRTMASRAVDTRLSVPSVPKPCNSQR